MATDRQTPCLYYVCAGLCTKGRKADHAHYCQLGMILWMCGLVASMTVDNVTIKMLLIFIPLAIYQFFTIGKGIIEDKIKRGRY